MHLLLYESFHCMPQILCLEVGVICTMQYVCVKVRGPSVKVWNLFSMDGCLMVTTRDR